jgi:hypothetical protein
LSGGESTELVKIAGNNLMFKDRTPAIDQPARAAIDSFLFAGDTILSDGSNLSQLLDKLNVQP